MDFYDYLKTQDGIDQQIVLEAKQATEDFFEKHPDRKLNLFFLEGGEVYDLIATDEYKIESENEYQFLSTKQMAFELHKILQERPSNLWESAKELKWVQEIKENPSCLIPYWTHVTYFSFNKTGEKV